MSPGRPDRSAAGTIVGATGGRKILHACSENLPVLRRATGVSLGPLFDTQIAAAFAGLGSSLSHAALILALFGEAIEDALGALVARRAGELSLPPELLLSRRRQDRALDAWNGQGSLAASIGFRGALLGAELDALAPVRTGV